MPGISPKTMSGSAGSGNTKSVMNICGNTITRKTFCGNSISRKAFIVLFFLISGLGFPAFPTLLQAQATHRIMTYNIRYDTRNSDDPDTWRYRRDFLARQLQFFEPDIFGIQEGLNNQVLFLDSALVNYSYAGVGRNDGRAAGEYSAVFYRTDRYRLVKASTFWLSEEPDRPSVGWDAALERICTYVMLEEIDGGQRFMVFNTHFDHIGAEARKNSTRLIIRKIHELNRESLPVILTGDLNLTPDEEPVQYLSRNLSDSRFSAELVFGPEGSFNDFNHNQPAERRIDYIFTESTTIHVSKYAVLNESRNGKYPSDHFPVLVEFEFRSVPSK